MPQDLCTCCPPCLEPLPVFLLLLHSCGPTLLPGSSFPPPPDQVPSCVRLQPPEILHVGALPPLLAAKSPHWALSSGRPGIGLGCHIHVCDPESGTQEDLAEYLLEEARPLSSKQMDRVQGVLLWEPSYFVEVLLMAITPSI